MDMFDHVGEGGECPCDPGDCNPGDCNPSDCNPCDDCECKNCTPGHCVEGLGLGCLCVQLDGCGGGLCDCLIHGLTATHGVTRCVANVAWVFASPCAFPCVFLFPSEWKCASSPGGDGPNPWSTTMLSAPCKGPQWLCECAFAYVCCPCAQYRLRSSVLDGDISKYKCCQGYMDGQYCCAAIPCLNSNPKQTTSACPCFSWYAGTHGDQGSRMCMCLEATCCCPYAFLASRQYMREDKALMFDPTEIRVCNCLTFFDCLASLLHCCACLCYCGGCLAQCFCSGVEGADECSRASHDASAACMEIVYIIRDGMKHVIWISIACLTTQMLHHIKQEKRGNLPPPIINTAPRAIGHGQVMPV